jgi:C_GCAxxG_C_C family probable redox protein
VSPNKQLSEYFCHSVRLAAPLNLQRLAIAQLGVTSDTGLTNPLESVSVDLPCIPKLCPVMSEKRLIDQKAPTTSSTAIRAVEQFCDGCNCSQAVLSVYAERFGLDEGLAMRIATGFGGGLGRMGGICGTLTGATLVLGLELGPKTRADQQAKEATYAATRQLQERFIQRHGSSQCRDLLEKDLSQEAAYQEARESGLFKTRCPRFVESVVALLDELINEKHPL